MGQRGLYVQMQEAEMREIEAGIEELRAAANEAEADVKIKYNREADRLNQELDETRDRLRELMDAADDAWRDLRSGVDRRLEEVRAGVDAAKKQLERG